MRFKPLLLLMLLCLSHAAWAQFGLQILPLRHSTVEQVLPVLQPLLEPGATLSGQGSQLFVRASPANVAELRRVLESIDRPARRLQISVRFDESGDAARRGIGASGRIGSEGTRIEIQAEDSARSSAERVDQRVQVLEGGRATIYAGTSRGVPQRQLIRTPTGVVAQETMVIQERATGFEVVPRIAGERVQVGIAPQQESGNRFGRIQTSVSARLGEWFEIGGASSSASSETQGLASAGRADSAQERRIWLKVEELAN